MENYLLQRVFVGMDGEMPMYEFNGIQYIESRTQVYQDFRALEKRFTYSPDQGWPVMVFKIG